jgi:NADH-quinone oxidoreductase subunit C
MDINTPVPTIYGDLMERYGDSWRKQAEELRSRFGASVIEEVRMPKVYPTDVPIVFVAKEKIVEVVRFMKDAEGFGYSFLADMTATDEEADPRFEVVYQLLAPASGQRIRLKSRVREDEEVPSLTEVWPAANWPEREVFDMFGIRFTGHPNLRRILMDSRWQGHPLRKDYPIRGYQFFPTSEPIDTSRLED